MKSLGNNDCMKNALKAGLVIQAFNTPYLPIMEPVVRALQALALIKGPVEAPAVPVAPVTAG